MADLPEFQRKEQLQPGTQPLPFGDASRNLAANSNVLGNLGAQISQQAAMTRSEISGTKMGTTPSGDLLPALTKSDDAFTKAYRTSAYATLSNQADALLSTGLNTLAEQGPLTQDTIEAFAQSSLEGFEKIAQLAPSVDQEALKNSFASNLIHAQGKLQAELIKQQKNELIDNFAAYTTQTGLDVFNAASDGNMDDAKKALNLYSVQAKEQNKAGLLTKSQMESANREMRLNLLTGREYKKGQEAASKNELDVYLRDYKNNKPSDMSNDEWVEVGGKILKLFNFEDSLDARFQTNKSSVGDLKIAQNQVDDSVIRDMQDNLKTKNFNDFMIKYYKSEGQKAARLKEITNGTDIFTDPSKYFQLSNDDKNEIYSMKWQELANSQGLDPWTAKTVVANTAGGSIPAFVGELNAKGQSPNPESLMQSGLAIEQLRTGRNANLDGVDKKTFAMTASFMRQVAGGTTPIDAAKVAEKQVLNVDESERNRRVAEKSSAVKEKFGKNNISLLNGASNITGMLPEQDSIGFAMKVREAFEDNFDLLGNTLDAESTTAEAFKARYGTTYVNGRKQEAQAGTIEQHFGITEAQIPLVQAQVAQQIEKDIVNFNKKFDAKQSDFRYDYVSPTSITYEQRLAAQEELSQIVNNATRQPAKGESFSDYAKKTLSNPEVKARYQALQNILKAPVEMSRREVEIIANELAEIDSRASLAELVKSKRFTDLSEEEQTRVIKEARTDVNPEKVDRIMELRIKAQAFEENNRPKIKRTNTDGESQEFYLQIYRAPNFATNQKGDPIYYVKLENMDGRTENFLGVANSMGGEVIYIPDTDDFNDKIVKYIDISSSGGQSAISDMQRSMQKRADNISETIYRGRANQITDTVTSDVAKEAADFKPIEVTPINEDLKK